MAAVFSTVFSVAFSKEAVIAVIGIECSLSTDFPPVSLPIYKRGFLSIIGAMVSTLNPRYHNVFMVVLPEI